MFKKAFCVLALSLMASTAFADWAPNPSYIVSTGEVLASRNYADGSFRLLVSYERRLYNCDIGTKKNGMLFAGRRVKAGQSDY
jgi:hypothetical protein